jgi:hypothetical protein
MSVRLTFTLRVIMALGKFQGVIIAATPTACLTREREKECVCVF